MAAEKGAETPVLHVIVVGFHHKKGCQVEYSYPPVIAGNAVDSPYLPEEWKHLPSLALPDGAHNYQKDTVFFHLPSREASRKTVYCVSCYRQIDAKDLVNRTADITRSTVQKSVCVISRLPLYGLLKAKLELITHAYFDERDFSKVELLEQTYNNLNASLKESLSQIYLGLSPRDAVVRFKHKLMVLFKLLLLERKVLFFGSPVEILGSTMLTVLSLYPGMLEYGLEQAVSVGQERQISPTLGVAGLDPQDGGTGEDFLEVRYHENQSDGFSKTKAELSELMPHMHSSPITNISSEAPESPTIPRDGVIEALPFSTSQDEKAKKESENRARHRSGSQLEVHKTNSGHSPQLMRNISDDLKVHSSSSSHPSLTSQDSSGSGGGGDSLSAVLVNEHSPSENINHLTQISAVQSGDVLSSNPESICGYVHKMEDGSSSPGFKTIQEGEFILSVENGHDPLRTRSDSVEELDSPESISKIDQEDGFSWEEDRLQLTLAVDTDDSQILQVQAVPSGEQGHEEATKITFGSAEPLDNAAPKSNSAQSSSNSSRESTPSRQKKNGVPGSPSGKLLSSPGQKTAAFKNKLSSALGKVKKSNSKESGSFEMKPIIKGEVNLHQDDFGFPLAIFTKGCVCHPYLSLQYHSILNDVNIRSFLLGATNILFKQQKQVTDVVVEIHDGKLDIKDRELQKQLNLTTADLRFSEVLVRMVTDEKSNMYLDGTEWEGSDEWIRAQFHGYLRSLLATMQTDEPKLFEDFGISFITAWRTTHNYRHWLETQPHPKIADVPAGHPYQGNLSVTDVKMRLNHSMQSTERGRKINAAVAQTGKYVVQTGKAVGGAFSSARSAMSSWFTSITNDWRHEEDDEEHKDKDSSENKTDHSQQNHVSNENKSS